MIILSTKRKKQASCSTCSAINKFQAEIGVYTTLARVFLIEVWITSQDQLLKI